MDRTGYVYLIENKIGNELRYKIGYTKHLKKRIKQLETGNPGELNIIHKFKTNWGRILEFMVHNKYSLDKVKNEWFNLEQNQIDCFLIECNKIENRLEILKENFYFKEKYRL